MSDGLDYQERQAIKEELDVHEKIVVEAMILLRSRDGLPREKAWKLLSELLTIGITLRSMLKLWMDEEEPQRMEIPKFGEPTGDT